MKTRFTADTRPRSSSGVWSWTTVWRITTLTLSSAPATTSAASDSQNHVDSPKTMIASPNPATDQTKTRPERRNGGMQPLRDGHRQRADRGRGGEPAERRRPDVQDVLGEHRQQRNRAAEQHREEIERDHAEDRLRAPDVLEAGQELARRARAA